MLQEAILTGIVKEMEISDIWIKPESKHTCYFLMYGVHIVPTVSAVGLAHIELLKSKGLFISIFFLAQYIGKL